MAEEFDANAAVRSYLSTTTASSETALRNSLYDAVGAKPDYEAELRRVAQATGVPIDTARAMPEELKRQAALDAINPSALARMNPVTAGFLSQPENAAIAHDDIGSLTALESFVGSLGRAARYITTADDTGGLLRDIGAGVLRANRGAAGVFQAGAELVAPMIEPLVGPAGLPLNPATSAAQWLARAGGQSETAAKRLSPAGDSLVGNAVSSGIQSLTANIMALPMALLPGGQGAALTMLAGSQGGQSYQQAREQGLPMSQALPFAASQAAIEYATEKLPLHVLLKDLNAGTSFGKTLLRNMATEIPGEQIATVLQDLNEWAVLPDNRNKPFSDYLAARPEAAAQTLIATMVGVGGQVSIMSAIQRAADNALGIERKAQAAEAAGAQIEQALQTAQASALRARDPQTFRAFVDHAAQSGAAPAELYIDAQTLANTLNQSGYSMAELRALSPAVADQLQAENLVPGADIRVPVADLLSAPSEVSAALVDHLRDAPDAMSRAEARQYLEKQGDAIKAEVEAELSRRDSALARQVQVDEVARRVQQQLDAAGTFRSEVNAAYAQMMGNFVVTQAERVGLTPQEFQQRYRLGVQSTAPAGARRLDQAPTSLEAVQAAWDAAGVQHAISERGDTITLSKIVVPEEARSAGTGTSAMQALVGYADAAGKHIVLSPSADFGGDPKRLAAFYKRFGFVENKGRRRAFSTSETMYREAPGKVLHQGERGALTFGEDITATPSVIALLENADLSTFLHESAHWFLEVQADLAARIAGRQADGDILTPGEQEVLADMDTLLGWFGVAAAPEQSALTSWLSMPLEERRDMHERFARGFERYAMEGQAPSLGLQQLFQRFRAWLVSVYRSISGLNVQLTDDVRQVMGRMLASDQAIQEAEQARAMGPLFETPEKAGMTPEEFADYQGMNRMATDEAAAQVDERMLKDMKWLSRARAKAIKARQQEAAALRAETRTQVARDVWSRPVYQAWQFLTAVPPKGEPTAAELAHRTNVAAHRDARSQAEAAARAQFREAVIASQPELKGIQRGQLLAKNKRQIEIDVQQRMLEWDRANPPPAKPEREGANGGLTSAPDAMQVFETGKLNEADAQYVDKAAATALKARKMTAKDGIHPDIVAELFGFGSGQQLIAALAAADKPGDLIDQLTDQRMLEEHGDITSPQALERAADEAVHNELRARVIATELKALAKATTKRETSDSLYSGGSVDVMAKAAREYAYAVVGRQAIKDLRPRQYQAAEARSARLALESLGDTAEAAMHKRNQLVNNFAAKAAFEGQAEVTRANDFFRRVLKGTAATEGKTRDWATVQAARAVLAEFGIGTKGETANAYLDQIPGEDGMRDVARQRIASITAEAKPVGDLTLDEFRALEEAVRGLWHLAKRTRQIEVDGRLIDRATAQADLMARLEEIGVPARIPGEGQAVTEGERRRGRLRTALAALRRVESWARAKDGGDLGPFARYVFLPVKEAADRYRADKAKYIKRYKELLQTVDLGRSRIEAPELGYTFGASRGGSGKQEILHAILHTGNPSNKRKLLLGRGWATENDITGALDTSRWDAFVRRMIQQGVLTKADFDFAQGVWDLLEDTKAQAQKAHRDVFGYYFDEVTAEGFSNEFGSYRGGYVPAMTDPEVVHDAATRALQEAEGQTLAYAFPSTSKGFTKKRVEYNRPLVLDLRTLSTHIDKVLLFSHLEAPVRDVRRVLGDNDLARTLHRVDPAAFDGLITPWLNRAARQTVETKIPGDNNLMRAFSWLRQRAGIAAMFANVSNTAQQITGFSIAAVRVRPKYLMESLAGYLIAPRQTARAVAESSIYMANRMDSEVAAMSGAIDDILLNPSVYDKAQNWTARHAYFMQSAVDNVMGPIIWTGAYNEALEAGQSERDAVRIADSVIRETQGSTLAEDVSRIETGNAFVRMFTQFAGYFNMQANLLGTEFGNAMHEVGLRRGMGRGLYVFILAFLVPNMLAELIAQAFKGGPDDEDKDGSTLDDWLMAVLLMGNVRAGLAMVPVLGQGVTAAVNAWNKKPYDDRISTSPAISMVESAVKAPKSVYNAAVNDGSARTAVRDVATLISISTGLPATAIARPLGYMAGMAENRIAPTGPVDTARGLVTGTPSPESKQ